MTEKALKLSKKYKTLLKKNGMFEPLVQAHFFAQLAHESSLEPISENLNYSKSALLRVFGKYFNQKTASEYARKPSKIANIVYANRMGNGGFASGDGWNYRGRGYIQLTGKNNYTKLSNDTGIDYVEDPDKLLTEVDAMVAAVWFWKRRGLTQYAMIDDARTITKKINGGYNGYADRLEHLKHMKEAFL